MSLLQLWWLLWLVMASALTATADGEGGPVTSCGTPVNGQEWSTCVKFVNNTLARPGPACCAALYYWLSSAPLCACEYVASTYNSSVAEAAFELAVIMRLDCYCSVNLNACLGGGFSPAPSPFVGSVPSPSPNES